MCLSRILSPAAEFGHSTRSVPLLVFGVKELSHRLPDMFLVRRDSLVLSQP